MYIICKEEHNICALFFRALNKILLYLLSHNYVLVIIYLTFRELVNTVALKGRGVNIYYLAIAT